MAKLMSKKTKEIVETTSVLVVIVLLIVFYIVYPLSTVPNMVGRPDRDKFKDAKFAVPNDPSFFFSKGLKPDTFSVESNDDLNLGALYFSPDTSKTRLKGTAILIHGDDVDRKSMVDFIPPLLNCGLAVVAYDQRAFGVSGGRFHAGGVLEAEDLSEVIAWLNLHGALHPPLIVVGESIGADAAIYAARTEKRISSVAAIDPYLTTTRWLSAQKQRTAALSIPLYKMIYFWWFQKVSGFPYNRTGVDDITAVSCKTLLVANQDELAGSEVNKLRELSSVDSLEIKSQPTNPVDLVNLISGWACAQVK